MHLENEKKFGGALAFVLMFLLAGIAPFKEVNAQVLQKKDTTKTEKVQVFDNSSYFDESKSNVWNVIKVNPLLILDGEIPFYYERKLRKKMSVEAGLGVTIKDPTYLAYRVVFDGREDLQADGFDYKTSITFEGMFRYYPTDYGFPEGFYIGPQLKFKNYNATYTYSNYLGSFTLPMKRSYTDLLFALGDQTELDENIYIDYYGGFGVRFKNINDVVQSYDTQGNMIYTSDLKKVSTPIISLGLKFGFSF